MQVIEYYDLVYLLNIIISHALTRGNQITVHSFVTHEAVAFRVGQVLIKFVK